MNWWSLTTWEIDASIYENIYYLCKANEHKLKIMQQVSVLKAKDAHTHLTKSRSTQGWIWFEIEIRL